MLHPRRVVGGLGQLDGREDALVVITTMLTVGAVETGGDSGFTQSALPDAREVGGAGEQGREGEGDDSEGLEHGYLTSGCRIKAVRVMGSVGGFQRARR